MDRHYELNLPDFYKAFSGIRMFHRTINKEHNLGFFDEAITAIENEMKRLWSRWNDDGKLKCIRDLRQVVNLAKIVTLSQEPPTVWFQFIRPYPRFFRVDSALDYLQIILTSEYQEVTYTHIVADVNAVSNDVHHFSSTLNKFLAQSPSQTEVVEIAARVKTLEDERVIKPLNTSLPSSPSIVRNLEQSFESVKDQPKPISSLFHPAAEKAVDKSRTYSETKAVSSEKTEAIPAETAQDLKSDLENTLDKLKSFDVFSEDHLNFIRKLVEDKTENSDQMNHQKEILFYLLSFTPIENVEDKWNKDFKKKLPLKIQLLLPQIISFDLKSYYDGLSQLPNENLKSFAQVLSNEFKTGICFPQDDNISEQFWAYVNGKAIIKTTENSFQQRILS